MRNRIKLQGDRVASTRSTTTVESTTFYQKKRHLYKYINTKLELMGVKVNDNSLTVN